MCLRKLFPNWFKPDPPLTGTKKALLFAINNYPGSANDLNGCLNDQRDIINKLSALFEGFTIRKFTDSAVSVNRFVAELDDAIRVLIKGDFLLVHYSGHGTQVACREGDEKDGYDEAIYLYDGPLIDDKINNSLQKIPEGATVVLMFDSCFSGTVTRFFSQNPHPIKNRFMPNPELKGPRKKLRRQFARLYNMKWIVLSGCGEQQTSADAYINGEYHGAFTYFALKALRPGMTYNEWMTKITEYLPDSNYDQAPTLEGDENLFSKIVFT
jgi:hypothetical protein